MLEILHNIRFFIYSKRSKQLYWFYMQFPACCLIIYNCMLHVCKFLVAYFACPLHINPVWAIASCMMNFRGPSEIMILKFPLCRRHLVHSVHIFTIINVFEGFYLSWDYMYNSHYSHIGWTRVLHKLQTLGIIDLSHIATKASSEFRVWIRDTQSTSKWNSLITYSLNVTQSYHFNQPTNSYVSIKYKNFIHNLHSWTLVHLGWKCAICYMT